MIAILVPIIICIGYNKRIGLAAVVHVIVVDVTLLTAQLTPSIVIVTADWLVPKFYPVIVKVSPPAILLNLGLNYVTLGVIDGLYIID